VPIQIRPLWRAARLSCELVSQDGRDLRVLVWAGAKLLQDAAVGSYDEALRVAAQLKVDFGLASTS
jgi:hypothetical protein